MGGILSSFSGRCFCCTQPAPSPSPGAGAACAVRTPSQQSSAAETLEQPADLEAQHRRGQDSGAGPQFATYMARLEAERRIRRRRRVADAWCSRSVCCSCWAHGASFSWLVGPVLDALSVRGELERLQLKEYYVAITEEYEMRSRRMGWWLYHLRVVRTTFNVVLPAILALQNVGYLSSMIMWLTWTLSLAVSLATAYLDLFRLDDFYEMFTRAAEHLKLEGWQYFGLLGRYAAHDTHQEALPVFMERVARLRRTIIDQEFPPNRKNGGSGAGGTAGASDLANPIAVSAGAGYAEAALLARSSSERWGVPYRTDARRSDRSGTNSSAAAQHPALSAEVGGAVQSKQAGHAHQQIYSASRQKPISEESARTRVQGCAARAAAGRTRPPPMFQQSDDGRATAIGARHHVSMTTARRWEGDEGKVDEQDDGAEMAEVRSPAAVRGGSGLLPPLTRNVNGAAAADMTQLSVTPQDERARDSPV